MPGHHKHVQHQQPPPNNKRQEVQVDIVVPADKCGWVIGKNGENIRRIMRDAKVQMILIQETRQVTGAKPLRIIGPPENVKKARMMVKELLENTPHASATIAAQLANQCSATTPKVMMSIGEILVPRCSVGMIIGRQGETIRQLAKESGAEIQFNREDMENGAEVHRALIRGSQRQINHAVEMITEVVKKCVNGYTNNVNSTQVGEIDVPIDLVGLVIGRGGECIKKIAAATGAHIVLLNPIEDHVKPAEKTFRIKGSASQVRHAQKQICDVVTEFKIRMGHLPEDSRANRHSAPTSHHPINFSGLSTTNAISADAMTNPRTIRVNDEDYPALSAPSASTTPQVAAISSPRDFFGPDSLLKYHFSNTTNNADQEPEIPEGYVDPSAWAMYYNDDQQE